VARWALRALAVAALAVPAPAMFAQAVTPEGAAAIVHQGNGRGAAACVSCHGPQLMGLTAMASPRLAGQDSAYVATQLAAFAAGERKNAIMLPVASSLSTAERSALAAYVSRLPAAGAVSADAAGSPPPAAEVLRRGEALAARGDWSHGVPACDRCHGPGGVGVGSVMPPLAAQSAVYLNNQLHAWKQEMRPPGPLSLMGAIAGRMSDADAAAVSAYYATLPAAPATARGNRP
jgi:cytochrome c553